MNTVCVAYRKNFVNTLRSNREFAVSVVQCACHHPFCVLFLVLDPPWLRKKIGQEYLNAIKHETYPISGQTKRQTGFLVFGDGDMTFSLLAVELDSGLHKQLSACVDFVRIDFLILPQHV